MFAGEWIGEKIQKGVAIAKLSRRFVIVSMKVNGRWVPDSLYMDIEAPAEGIYNIARGGFYNAYMHGNDLEVSVKELGDLAEEVVSLISGLHRSILSFLSGIPTDVTVPGGLLSIRQKLRHPRRRRRHSLETLRILHRLKSMVQDQRRTLQTHIHACTQTPPRRRHRRAGLCGNACDGLVFRD